MRANQVPPRAQVERRWRLHIIFAGWANCHREYPFGLALTRYCSTGLIELQGLGSTPVTPRKMRMPIDRRRSDSNPENFAPIRADIHSNLHELPATASLHSIRCLHLARPRGQSTGCFS